MVASKQAAGKTVAHKSAVQKTIEARPPISLTAGNAWRELIETRIGVHFSDTRTHQLSSALWKRMQELDVRDYGQYLGLVTGLNGNRAAEWSALAHALTNHETYFFRHEPTFHALREHLLPLLAKHGGASIWSAGCSTGEEVYSIAMACSEVIAEVNPRACFDIFGSDVSETAVATAATGVYGPRAWGELPAGYRKYLTPPAAHSAGYQVTEPVRRMVRFSAVNLIQAAAYPAQQFDIVLCQNVLVYFRAEVRQQALDSLAARVKPGGYLIPGPGEIAGLDYGSPGGLRCQNMGELQVFRKAAECSA